MTGDTDPEDEGSDSSVVAKNGSKMKCCPTRGCSVYVCTRCFAVYHRSCSKKFSNLKIIDPIKCTAICCGEADLKIPQASAGGGEVDMAMYRERELEVKYLRMLLEEVQDKNRVLQMNNDLLLEKLGRTGQQKIGGNNRDKSRDVSGSNTDVRQSILVNRQEQHSTTVEGGAVKRGPGLIQSATDPRCGSDLSSKGTVPGDHSEKYRPKQRHYSAVAAVDNQVAGRSTGDMPTESDNDGYQIVENRRNSRYRKKLGTGGSAPDHAGGFAGGDRRVWLYLYRVKRSATEEVVAQYIKNKPGYERDKITVRELPTDENRLKCFVVIAPIEKKDEMYNSSFWPNFVGIKRFDFDKHRSFLDQNRGFL